jgi:predicted acetyltransferase
MEFAWIATGFDPGQKTAMLWGMALKMRWVGNDELDGVAQTRWMCYAHARKDLARFKENIHAGPWGRPGDYLLAERNGEAVGTASSYAMTMWVRGSAVSCQGVAYVGTIKSARRRGGKEPGVASAVMREVLRIGREREHIVSALMPFRASFYEHFGYGLVERRADWTIPLSVLPATDCTGWRISTSADRAAQMDQWQRSVESGQCDIERSAARWKYRETNEEEGMIFVDRESGSVPARASAFVMQESAGGRNVLKIQEWSADSLEAFAGMLSFFGTMRDQFSMLSIVVPADWQINRMLTESQIPHRPVEHATATASVHTRMQVRILDHKKYLEGLRWPAEARGRATISVAECEGTFSRFTVEVDSGRAQVAEARGEVDFECADRHWAGIATGDLPASQAVRLGLARLNKPGAMELLDALSIGPVPCCRESF